MASSHDVMYVGARRVYEYEKNGIKKHFRKKQYENLKIQEVRALSCCDLIVTQNEKDIDIFQDNDSLKEKRFIRISPYYDDYSDVNRIPQRNKLIFYGAMSRKENIESVIWFVNNVFSNLIDSYELYVIGSNPSKEILNLESKRIHITGFLTIDEIKSLMSTCTCMVAPLQLGSGIKVKVLEAFSAGIPVLTNDIGIEGIFAKKNKEYIHCVSPEDFVNILNNLENGFDIDTIGKASKFFVLKCFNKEISANKYINELKQLVEYSAH